MSWYFYVYQNIRCGARAPPGCVAPAFRVDVWTNGDGELVKKSRMTSIRY
jgi:hypothetical protein